MNPGVVVDLQAAIAQTEQALRDLSVEWERFFAGERRTPPQPQRVALQRRLQMLAESASRAADQFRIEQLQSRFMSYTMMWERQLRAREEGNLPIAAVARPTSASAARGRPDASRPGSVHAEDGDAIWNRFKEAKAELGQSTTIQREAFLAQLEAQRERLQAKLGGRVRFDVVVEDGKVRLAARKAGHGGQQG